MCATSSEGRLNRQPATMTRATRRRLGWRMLRRVSAAGPLCRAPRRLACGCLWSWWYSELNVYQLWQAKGAWRRCPTSLPPTPLSTCAASLCGSGAARRCATQCVHAKGRPPECCDKQRAKSSLAATSALTSTDSVPGIVCCLQSRGQVAAGRCHVVCCTRASGEELPAKVLLASWQPTPLRTRCAASRRCRMHAGSRACCARVVGLPGGAARVRAGRGGARAQQRRPAGRARRGRARVHARARPAPARTGTAHF